MGMHGHLSFLLLLLLGLHAPVLLGMPRVVTLSEDSVPGTLVAKVTVSCSNATGSPNVTLHSMEPGHPFNPIAISAMSATTFQTEVTLRAGAELDAYQANQYTLTLWAACPGEEEVEEQFFVRVTPGQALRCDTPFASVEGAVVQVSADVAPRTPLYSVLPGSLGELTFRLQNHDTPLTLTRRGLVLVPDNGFDPIKETQMFRLEIEVTDQHGHNCSGAVRVEVLPSRCPNVTFLEPQQNVSVPEGTSPLEVITQVQATGENVRYAILTPVSPALFTIDERTGKIRNIRQLEVANAQLRVQAFSVQCPDNYATAIVNVIVNSTNWQAPSCVPAISVSQVPETISPGSTLETLMCTDPIGADGDLRYALEGPLAFRSRFCMEGPRLQVNTTLDCDSEAADPVGFQLTATIVVTAGGQPLRSTRVPVLVTVTPVNEFTPACPRSATFTVPETATFGSAVGRVAGTDRDYPRNSLEYSLEGGTGPAQPFSIDTRTGEIHVVGPLDAQRQKRYRLTVRLTDTHNDLNPAKRWSCLCNVTVSLQAVLDQAPVCTPEVQELQITTGVGGRQTVTRLVCQGTMLTYTIAGGNEEGRFQLEGNTLLYLPDDLAEPRTFVLLVEVWGYPSVPHHSTVVALVVHVTPRSTPVPASTTTQHTTLQKDPLVVTRTEVAWHPPAWFVAVLTISAALLLAILGCVARSLLHSNRDTGKLVLGKSPWDVVEQRGDEEEQGRPHTGSLGQFDGCAQDPCTGRDYLFNSVTGARRWI
ncbi:cadherin-related family member 4 isoform X1 [Heliangelus exortis]|uniref:cadherin-related family member 4 isoform X1 n=1 Tax=Heliangelus exortis TaxID=472823 RepID=UPI003A9474F0